MDADDAAPRAPDRGAHPGAGDGVPAPGGQARPDRTAVPEWIAGRAARDHRLAREVRAELEQLATEYGAEEAIVVTITHDHVARRRSYELLAEAFELEPAGAAGAQSTVV